MTIHYDPTQLLLDKMDNSSKLYEFMSMQRQSERFISKLESECESIKDFVGDEFYEDVLISVWSSSVYLKLLMQAIGTKVGCPQIINLYEGNMNKDIDSYWNKCSKVFEAWKNITRTQPFEDGNVTSSSLMRYTLLRQNAVLIDALIDFLGKVKQYVNTHQLSKEIMI